ncbi:uncharacterized protein LOC107460353 [Arachis duranensis]|uniref:Uncharacterized protein LOC107460353 n=1 Tax=Arachis duranensis TaxID=130453 RepID=A0A9C6WGR6_ARADU|nr:uncharacterized protein LOC107460353 [Arachis duranensis]
MHAIVQRRRTREFRGFIPLTQVMEHCIARLYVAMFNAILWESALEIPTDPVSDPIVDSKVLPIPAGDLSFGSGAQLKNSVGNWSRWLTDMFSMDVEDCLQDQESGENDESRDNDSKPKSFLLLNNLSDLLMLPKDMLMDKQVRREVCPSITLSLIIRVLCNFTPDEFCPDPVPGIVLKSLHEEVSVYPREVQPENPNSYRARKREYFRMRHKHRKAREAGAHSVSRAATAWKLVLAGNEQGNEH